VVSAKGAASTSWPSSRPSSLFVATTGPADETKPPTIDLPHLKLPIVSSKNGSSSLLSLRSKSIEQFQKDSSNPLIPRLPGCDFRVYPGYEKRAAALVSFYLVDPHDESLLGRRGEAIQTKWRMTKHIS